MELADVRLVNNSTVAAFHAQIGDLLQSNTGEAKQSKSSIASTNTVILAGAVFAIVAGVVLFFARRK